MEVRRGQRTPSPLPPFLLLLLLFLEAKSQCVSSLHHLWKGEGGEVQPPSSSSSSSFTSSSTFSPPLPAGGRISPIIGKLFFLFKDFLPLLIAAIAGFFVRLLEELLLIRGKKTAVKASCKVHELGKVFYISVFSHLSYLWHACSGAPCAEDSLSSPPMLQTNLFLLLSSELEEEVQNRWRGRGERATVGGKSRCRQLDCAESWQKAG